MGKTGKHISPPTVFLGEHTYFIQTFWKNVPMVLRTKLDFREKLNNNNKKK